MGTMLLPVQVLLIPQYIMFKTFGWINTYLPIIIPQFWQEFLQPLIYISKPKLYPVSIVLKMFSDPNTQTNWAGLFAMTTLSIIPVVVVFMVFQRYLVEGVATTGLKG